MSLTINLNNPEQAHKALQKLWLYVKRLLLSGTWRIAKSMALAGFTGTFEASNDKMKVFGILDNGKVSYQMELVA